MSITFSEITAYVKKYIHGFNSILSELDGIVKQGRQEQNLPVYTSKYRVKSPESVFLKTKRKKITVLDNITDYAGFRLLCLFEKDIFLTHDFFLGALLANGFSLRELKIYNWEDNDNIDLIIGMTKKYYDRAIPLIDEKKSGYKSIHYVIERVVGDKSFTAEIQLRTLLQDVWGELEHSLSYKRGSIHPHIKKSFSLLARDLQTMDVLMTHLREINEREQCGDKYSNEKLGPRGFFTYEEELFPKIFIEDGPFKDKFEIYWAFIKTYNLKNPKVPWLKKARELYSNLFSQLKKQDFDSDLNLQYWNDMEDAFLLFYEGKYNEALKTYEKVKEKHPDHYVVFFRIGEIYFIQSDLPNHIENALAAFDESEKILDNQPACDYKNLFKVKARLAYTYWMLGSEYIDIALEKIMEARKIVDKNTGTFPDQDYENLINNVCWYALEKYVLTNSDSDYNIARSYFMELETLLEKETATSNMFDSVAMFYYHTYKRSKDAKDLAKAKEYCKTMGDKVNYTSFNFRSMNMQLNHVQEIMNTK